MNRHLLRSIFSIAFAYLFTFSLSAQTILNGSFEQWPDSCTVDTPPISWDNRSDDFGPDQRGITCPGNISAFEGDSYLSLVYAATPAVNEERVSQDISGLIPGNTYEISFHVIASDVFIYTPVHVMAYIDSNMIFYTPELELGDPWAPFSFTFTASSTTARLMFGANDFGGSCLVASIGIDDVRINEYVGLEEIAPSPFYIYPNPVNETIHILGIETNEKLIITTTQGKELLTVTNASTGIDISSLAPGIYFLKDAKSQRSATRFVKR